MSLSEKIQRSAETFLSTGIEFFPIGTELIKVEDVKEAVKELKDKIELLATNNLTSGNDSEDHKLLRNGYSGALSDIKKKIDEIFGSELVK